MEQGGSGIDEVPASHDGLNRVRLVHLNRFFWKGVKFIPVVEWSQFFAY